jgi:hypothetical protein
VHGIPRTVTDKTDAEIRLHLDTGTLLGDTAEEPGLQPLCERRGDRSRSWPRVGE